MRYAIPVAVLCSVLATVLPAQPDPKLEVLVERAQQAEKNGDLLAAIRDMRLALKRHPKRKDLTKVLSALHTQVGLRDYGEKNLDAALLHFGTADRLTPNNEGILQSLGVIYHAKRRRFEAERYMLRVLKINPKNLPALQVMADLAAERDDTKAASKYLARAAEVDPESRKLQYLANKFGKEARVEKGFVTRVKGNFRIQYQGGKEAGVERNINQVFGILQQAHREIYQQMLGRPTTIITVVVYTTDQYKQVRSTHSWAGAYYDGKIRVALTPGTSLQASLRGDLRHELTHAFLFALHPKAPLWVHEGYAQFVEGRSVSAATNRFRGQGQRLLPEALFLDKFNKSKHLAVVQRGYAQSLMAVGYLHRIGTRRQFRSFLGLVGRGVSSADALRQVYRLNVATMLQRAASKRPAQPR